MATADTNTIANQITHATGIALFLALVSLPAFAWTPAPCSAAAGAARAAFAVRVRAAKPGEPLYVAHPMPDATQRVVIDFVSQFPGGQSADWHDVAQRIASGELAIDIKPVEDWTSDRCSPDRGDDYFLVTVRDAKGAEVARGAILATGKLSNVGLLAQAPTDVKPLPSLDAAIAKLAARGIRARDPQYIATGGTLFCRMLDPCVALRNDRGIYLLRDEQLFLLPIGTPIYAAAPPKEPNVSIGTNAFVVATPVR